MRLKCCRPDGEQANKGVNEMSLIAVKLQGMDKKKKTENYASLPPAFNPPPKHEWEMACFGFRTTSYLIFRRMERGLAFPFYSKIVGRVMGPCKLFQPLDPLSTDVCSFTRVWRSLFLRVSQIRLKNNRLLTPVTNNWNQKRGQKLFIFASWWHKVVFQRGREQGCRG